MTASLKQFQSKRRLERDESGAALIVATITITTLVILVGLAVDLGMLESRKLATYRALTGATLRASQLRYDGETDHKKIEAAASEVANLNFRLSNLSTSEVSTSPKQFTLNQANGRISVDATLHQPTYFARLLPGVGMTQNVTTHAAASYNPKAEAEQYYRHIYIVVSTFTSMNAEFHHTETGDNEVESQSIANRTKAKVTIDGLQTILQNLTGQYVTLLGYGANEQILTTSLPINDEPSSQNPSLTNREYAKERAKQLHHDSLGADLSPVLARVFNEIKSLPEADRKTSLVLIISDGVAFNSTIPSHNPEECVFEAGQALQLTNQLRAVGSTVSSLGVFSLGYSLEDEKSQVNNDDLWLSFSLYGRKFLGALAGLNTEAFPCSLEKGITSELNKEAAEGNHGKYLEPASAEEFSSFLDEITSQDAFLKNLPRRAS